MDVCLFVPYKQIFQWSMGTIGYSNVTIKSDHWRNVLTCRDSNDFKNVTLVDLTFK